MFVTAAKFTSVQIFLIAPTQITRKIVDDGLIALGFQILRRVSDDTKAILNSDQQVYAGISRQYFHGRQRHL